MNEQHAAHCENCETALIGGYCHVCGQRAHNPLHSFVHAVEEVFESLWHLDGRIFRTVRDIVAPGRLATNYLAGQRVRYIAPLRLFVILCLVTFFVGKLTLHLGSSDANGDPQTSPTSVNVRMDESPDDDFARLATPADVLALREKRLRDFLTDAGTQQEGWVLRPIAGMVQDDIDAKARQRLQALGVGEREIAAGFARTDDALAKVRAGTEKPVDIGDGLLASWIERRAERVRTNLDRIKESPDEFIRLFLGAVPGALFLLVPLFALFLKGLYLGSGRGYLEHLVVALYSHCFLLVALLSMFCLVGMRAWAGTASWGNLAFGLGLAAIWLWVPVYLLLMQKRVYGQGWLVTLLKFLVVGSAYTVLLTFALTYALLAGLSS